MSALSGIAPDDVFALAAMFASARTVGSGIPWAPRLLPPLGTLGLFPFFLPWASVGGLFCLLWAFFGLLLVSALGLFFSGLLLPSLGLFCLLVGFFLLWACSSSRLFLLLFLLDFPLLLFSFFLLSVLLLLLLLFLFSSSSSWVPSSSFPLLLLVSFSVSETPGRYTNSRSIYKPPIGLNQTAN